MRKPIAGKCALIIFSYVYTISISISLCLCISRRACAPCVCCVAAARPRQTRWKNAYFVYVLSVVLECLCPKVKVLYYTI